jgi:amidase
MKKPTRRDARLAAAAASAEAPVMLELANAPMSDIIHALASGRATAGTDKRLSRAN